MRVEHGRDNAGRRLSGNSDHDTVGEPEHTHTHTHIRYIRASGLRLCLEHHVSREHVKIILSGIIVRTIQPRQFLLCHLLEKFVRTLDR